MAEKYVKVSTSQAKLAEAEANFKLAGTDKVRYTALYERRTVPKQTLDKVDTRYRVNQAQVDRAKRELQEALAAIGGSTSLPIEEQPTIKEAQAKLEQARLNLEYTKVTAKITGYITRRQVEVGNWVQPGQPLMMLVPLEVSQLWIQANFKETELTHVYLGQPASGPGGHLPGRRIQGPGGLHHGRHRFGLLALAAGERHRQLGQGGAAHPGEDRPAAALSRQPAAPDRHVHRGHHRHPGAHRQAAAEPTGEVATK